MPPRSHSENRMLSDRARLRLVRGVAIPLGMIVGGVLQNAGRVFLPMGSVKEFFTSGFVWNMASSHTGSFFYGTVGFGPLAIDVSIIALLVTVLTERLAMKIFG